MSAVTPSSVRFSWSPATSDGSATITSYTVKFLQQDGSTYSTSNECDGSSSIIINNLYCDVPMTVFLASPFSLSKGDLIKAVVLATNEIGDSVNSDLNTSGILVQTVPDTPSTGPSRGSASTSTSITVDYGPDTEDGGSTILSYSLEWDQGTSTWVSLIGETVYSTANQFQISSLTTGDSYKFRYRVFNAHGWSDYSPETQIIVASAPDQITVLSVTQSTVNSANVLISWTAPASNGAALSAYLVEIRQSDGTTFTEDSANCDGSDSNILAAASCEVPMSSLWAAPYTLT